jgi:hypothetical protein
MGSVTRLISPLFILIVSASCVPDGVINSFSEMVASPRPDETETREINEEAHSPVEVAEAETSFATAASAPVTDPVEVAQEAPARAATDLPGLIHLWRGEDDANDSVGGADGTLGASTNYAPGLNGQAFSFDGQESSVINPLPVDIGPDALPQITMGMWVNLRSVPSMPNDDDFLGWVIGHDDGGYDRSLALTDSRYGSGVAGGTGQPPHQSTLINLKDNLDSWHCVAVSYDRDAQFATFYADGMSQTVFANPGFGNANVTLGGQEVWQFHTVDGLIDEVFIFDRVLTEAELDEACTDLATPVDTDPVITCPADLTIQSSESTDPSNTGMAAATDNCSVSTGTTIAFSDVSSVACPTVTITRTWTAADACGASSSCAQIITVQDIDSDGDGMADCNDGCPNDAAKIDPGECGCGVADSDSDGDGAADCLDDCPNDQDKTEPGQCGCGVADTDSDSDATADCNDGCPNDPAKTVAGVCGCGFADTDSDQDGTADCNDGCPNDGAKTVPGQCGCGAADTDSDGDNAADCLDECLNDQNKSDPGQCGCGVADTDADADGTADCNDGCPSDENNIDPGVCGCGASDEDTDGDGVEYCNDNCPDTANADQADSDDDGIGDACDSNPICLRLSNHPDGNAQPPLYGARFDGLFTGDENDIYTCDFEDPIALMHMVITDTEIFIFGTARCGLDTGDALDPDESGLTFIGFTYANGINRSSSETVTVTADPSSGGTTGWGFLTPMGWGPNPFVPVPLEDQANSSGLVFETKPGHRGHSGLSGFGWMNHSGEPHMYDTDWLFTANVSEECTSLLSCLEDGDSDGIADCLDICPFDPGNDADQDGICGDFLP